MEEADHKTANADGRYVLKLYVTGSTPRSSRAIVNARKLLEQHLKGEYDLKVVDILRDPASARRGQIIAAPTLVKEAPEPLRRFIGDMSDTDRILRGLEIRAIQ